MQAENTLFESTARRRDWTRGSITRNIWALALPIITTNLLQSTFNVVDIWFVGRLGPDAIAAVSMSGVVMMLIIVVGAGLSIATTAMVARRIGARNRSGATKIAVQSLQLTVLASLCVTVLGVSTARHTLIWLGASPDVWRLGTPYLRIIFAGCLPMFLLFMVGAILLGAGDAMTPMKVMGGSTLLNILLDYLLIFGPGPFPRMGVMGAAVGSTLARGLGMVVGMLVLCHPGSAVPLRGARLHLDWKTMGTLVKLGIPGSAQLALRNLSALVLTRLVAEFGTLALAGYGIGMRINMVLMSIGFGIGASSAALVGQNLGAGQPSRAERTGWTAAGQWAAVMATVGAIFWFYAPHLVGLFSSETGVVEAGGSFIRTVSWVYPFLAISLVLARSLNGAGDTVSPTVIITVGLFGLRIPLALFLSRGTGLGVEGIWLAIASSMVTDGSLMALWFSRGVWKRKRV